MAIITNKIEASVELITSKLGKNWVIGTPLGIGKPNPIINQVYEYAREHSDISLDIFTALSLEIPQGNSLLERRFLQSFTQRFFGQYPELVYIDDVKHDCVPANIKVREFYMQSGKMLHSRTAQNNYVSSNYTHVARDMVDRDVNVILQMVAVKRGKQGNRYSLSCNPDLTLDIVRIAERKGKPRPLIIAMVNEHLPFMSGQAEVDADFFDLLYDDSDAYFEPFAAPAQPINLTDYSIGLLSSTLLQDGGTLQIGIGSLADALVYSTQLRQQNNETYQAMLESAHITKNHQALINEVGDTKPFVKGLYAASEMFVEGFAQLYESGILKRKVYPDAEIQALLNQEKITEQLAENTLSKLLEWQVIEEFITAKAFKRLQYLGILKTDLSYDKGKITLPNGQVISADLHDSTNLQLLEQHGLGDKLAHGAVLHAAFFMGSKRFYQWLHGLDENQQALFQMTPVSQINELYGGEALDRVQRVKARFINTCMKVDLMGAAASDTLENHQVVSGVGGQYNFVAMAHALDDSRSILMLRSVHAGKDAIESNIVWKYGYCTIPRHLRDIVVTEYGMADLRGQSDETCVKRLICIADSRFQESLRAQAVYYNKLSPDWDIPEQYRHNTPEMVAQHFTKAQEQGYFPPYPFGEDFTEDEKKLIAALKWLKLNTKNKYSTLLTLIKAQFVKAAHAEAHFLKMMQLNQPTTFKEKLSAKLLVMALRHV